MKRSAILGICLALFWLLLSGYFDNALLLAFGALSVVFALWIDRKVIARYPLNTPSGVLLHFPAYAAWLIYEVYKANIAVVKNIWFPARNPISPTVSRIPMLQESALGRSIFANSITLTPGTVSFDIKDNEVLVHGIVEEAIIELEDGEMNQRAARLESRSH